MLPSLQVVLACGASPSTWDPSAPDIPAVGRQARHTASSPKHTKAHQHVCHAEAAAMALTGGCVSCWLLRALAVLALSGSVIAQLPNYRVGLPPDGPRIDSQPGYPVLPRDVPFGQRYEVRFKYYNLSYQPRYYLNAPPLDVACCYSFNAYWTANAALHPYWFKDFGLERMCRQDVCLSIWTKDHSHDLMFKVTDVCDPKDCPTPFDVKVEPYKGRYLFFERRTDFLPSEPVYMYFVRCWADGLPQPDLVNTLPGPPVANSRHWMIKTSTEQWKANQAWNARNGKSQVPLGMLRRPWATQRWLPDYKPSDWPKGSRKKITDGFKPKAWQCTKNKQRPPSKAYRDWGRRAQG